MPNGAVAATSHAQPVGPQPTAGRPLRFDEKNLWPGVPGRRFNPSILADGDGGHVFWPWS